jgi:hypothetical protein
MDRKNALSLAALTLLAGAVTAGSTLPAVAAKPGPVVPPPPAEAGCYNLDNDGHPTYQRLIASITQTEQVPATPLTPALYDKAVIEESDRGFASGNMSLESPSCVEATYVLEVYEDTAQPDGSYRLLARNAQNGDGVRPFLALDTAIRGYAGQSVRISGYVQDAFGRVIDRVDVPLSSDDARFTAPEDGLPDDGSGGQQFWG